jgi:hypothetical protein
MSETALEFDLQPDPRILPMLGEINLAQWKCLAELIDNSVDGFLELLRAGQPLDAPEVSISIPTNDTPSARVVVRDNGPGMSREKLEKAVRAGYSGNDPISNLGLFGMGFNIATARLGTVTTVWTTRKDDPEWIGLKIDFDALRDQRHFRTQALSRAKSDRAEHGTEVIVEGLKPEQRQWLSKTANKSKVIKELSRAYSAMLRPNGNPITFRLHINNKLCVGRQHCIWGCEGNPERIVPTAKYGEVSAYQVINVNLPGRPFCVKCWQWLAADETECPACLSAGQVVVRNRSIRGWLGIQRYLSENEFGIDFLRHGRKIEIANKDLFNWQDGEIDELEYPIDDPRNRGRIVGEIHLDHCRVSYTKDRFDRADPAWEDMVHVVRGDGPLRPDKATDLGFSGNTSPLFRLFQVFRRSTPKPKVAGCYAKLLVVPDNDRAVEMGNHFHDMKAEYQTDAKWWELVQEADLALLRGAPSASAPQGPGAPPAPTLDGFAPPGEGPAAPLPPPVVYTETPLPSLGGIYRSDLTDLRWDVRAIAVEPEHPQLCGGDRPWAMRRLATGEDEFYVNPRHRVFASATMTPLDALIAQLAWMATDFLRDSNRNITFASILAELRIRHANRSALEPNALASEARQTLMAVATTVAPHVAANDPVALFQALTLADQQAIQHRMATKRAGNPSAVIGQGRFLEYAPYRVILDFFKEHPELFLDGNCWDDAYGTLDYGHASATEEAQRQVSQYYEALLADAVWMAEQDTSDLAEHSRERVLRAQLALDLIAPTATQPNE